MGNINTSTYKRNGISHGSRRGRGRRPRPNEYNPLYDSHPLPSPSPVCSVVSVNNVCPPRYTSSVSIDTQIMNSGQSAFIPHSDYSNNQEPQCSCSTCCPPPPATLVQSSPNTTIPQNTVYYSTVPIYTNQSIANYSILVPATINPNEYTYVNAEGMMAPAGTTMPLTTQTQIEALTVGATISNNTQPHVIAQQPKTTCPCCINNENTSNVVSTCSENARMLTQNSCRTTTSNCIECARFCEAQACLRRHHHHQCHHLHCNNHHQNNTVPQPQPLQMQCQEFVPVGVPVQVPVPMYQEPQIPTIAESITCESNASELQVIISGNSQSFFFAINFSSIYNYSMCSDTFSFVFRTPNLNLEQ